MALALLLVTQIGVGSTVSAVVDGDNDIEWTDAAGAEKAFFKPGDTAIFFLQDADLPLAARSGTGTWTNLPSAVPGQALFDLASGETELGVGGTLQAANAAVYTSSTTGYDRTNPQNTPLAEIPIVTVDGASVFELGYGGLTATTAGTFTLFTNTAEGATVVANFKYHAQDVFGVDTDGGTGADADKNRAKVTSGSDSGGEWIEISEVASVGVTTSDATSGIFRGQVDLSASADATQPGDGRVWIQDGDTLTVTFYGTDHVTAVGSATATVDDKNPTISGVSPADGTITNNASPTINFTIADDGSGLSTTVPGNNVDVFIVTAAGDCRIKDEELSATSLTGSQISMFFRAATGVVWTDAAIDGCVARGSGGFGVDSGTLGDNGHGTEFTLKIVATDVAGNQATSEADITIDGAAPDMLSGITGTGNTINLTFNESLNAGTVTKADFKVTNPDMVIDEVIVGGVNVSGGTTAEQLLDELVTLVLANALPSDAEPKVTLAGSISDKAGNAVSADSIARATDRINPSLTIDALGTGLLATGGTTGVTFSADENLVAIDATLADGDGCTCLSVSGGTGFVATLGAVTLTTPSIATYSFTQATFSDTGIYGIMIQGRDRLTNRTKVGATSVTEDVSSQIVEANVGPVGVVVSLGNWPLADEDMDGVLEVSVKGGIGGDVAAASTITGIDWELGTITLDFDRVLLVGETVNVSYSYVNAAQVVQVDVDAPVVTFGPEGETQDKRTFIRIFFDETEYAGDTHTTVDVTTASLTDPDGNVTDILGSLSTGDNKTFSYLPPADLVKGEYTITAAGTDDAGNATGDKTGTFTVIKRALVAVPLELGWNLVSLPGDPVNSDINVVINVAEVETVLTYVAGPDGGFLAAVRDGDSFVGTLDTMDGSTAYLIYTTSGDDLQVDIPGLTIGERVLPPDIALQAGWNLVPSASPDPAFPVRDPDVYFSGLEWSRAYYYEAGQFKGIVPDTQANAAGNADNEVQKGRGFWLYLRDGGTLVP